MGILEIIQTLLYGVLVSSIIGINRESRHSPAGMRTYNLVCLGAVIYTLIAKELFYKTIQMVNDNPDLAGTLTADPSRIIAQIVSGIGFLGAGTIILNKQKVKGLSTASSLWVTAAIGIAVGLGYYALATLSSILVVIILATFKKLISKYSLKKLSVTYTNEMPSSHILKYLEDKKIEIRQVDTKFSYTLNQDFYTDVILMKCPHGLSESDLVKGVSKLKDVYGAEMIEF